MIIKRHNGLNNRGITDLIIKGLVDLSDHGYSDDTIDFDKSMEAVVASDNSGELGIIVYSVHQSDNKLMVQLSYVDPLFRQGFAYHLMWKELHRIAIEKNCWRIHAIMHPKNTFICKVAEAEGFKQIGILYEYTINDEIFKQVFRESIRTPENEDDSPF